MHNLLPNLNPSELEVFAKYLTNHQVSKGTILVELGSSERDLYLLISGTCEVYQKFKLGAQLFALRVGALEAPSILGEANLLLSEKRNATIIVSKDMIYHKLSPEDFDRLKVEHPAIAIKLLEEIGSAVSKRFLTMQKTLMDKFLAEEPRPSKGLDYLKKFMGNAHPCSAELARKLFNIEQPAMGEPPFDYLDPEVE